MEYLTKTILSLNPEQLASLQAELAEHGIELNAAKREFIKNVVDVDVDGLKQVNHYRVKAMYNVFGDDDVASISFVPLDEFDLTWKEIESEGGIGEINKQIKEEYGAEED